MKMGLALIAATSALAFAAPAYAQDAETQAAFTGPWVAGLVGYDNSRAGSDVDDDSVDDDFDDGINGVSYGVGAGYDMALGGLVVGVEGEWMESEAGTAYDLNDDVGLGITNLETGRDLYVGGRLGFLVGKNAMIYAKGGYTNAKYNILASDGVTDTDANFKLDGWRAGAGVEVAVTNNVFVKAEYRYSNYNNGEVEAPSGVESDNFDVDVDRHQGVVGVGLRF